MEQPIGVIDSGVGGLTVAKELMRQLPKEEFIYLGDTLRCPYGSRTKDEVRRFTWQMVNFLDQYDIKMLVVACNTATAFVLPELKAHLNIPVVGVIQPGARAAIKTSRNRKIGVIGTEGTISSKAYPNVLKDIHSEIEVYSLACPRLVPMVEQGILSGPEAEHIVDESLKPLQHIDEMDTLILGCTHYPLLKPVIQKVLGNQVTIISSGEETAREVSTILAYGNLLFHGERKPNHKLFTTGNLALFQHIANNWFGYKIPHIKSIRL